MRDWIPTSSEDRFYSKIEIDEETGCWNWAASKWEDGYGAFHNDGKILRAHRVSYEFFIGSIPEGLFVRHMCHNRCCVNPHHLELGDHQDNMDDRARAGRTSYETGLFGEYNSNSKLSAADVLEMRRLHSTGEYKQRELAKMFGVVRQHVSNIVRQINWQNL